MKKCIRLIINLTFISLFAIVVLCTTSCSSKYQIAKTEAIPWCFENARCLIARGETKKDTVIIDGKTKTKLSHTPAVMGRIPPKKHMKNELTLNLGFSSIVSDVRTAEYGNDSPFSGASINLMYEHALKKSWSAGIIYSYNGAELGYHNIENGSRLSDYHFTIQYLAPQIVYRYCYSVFCFKLRSGVGYSYLSKDLASRYEDSGSNNSSGWGANLHAGIEVMTSKHFAITLESGVTQSFFPKKDFIKTASSDRYGAFFFDFRLGMGYYF